MGFGGYAYRDSGYDAVAASWIYRQFFKLVERTCPVSLPPQEDLQTEISTLHKALMHQGYSAQIFPQPFDATPSLPVQEMFFALREQ